MHYSGGGYTIVQQLMIDVSGKPFSELLKSTVLDPLGISEGGFLQPLPSTLSPRAAAGHLHDGSVLPGRWYTHPELAAAGLWSTPSDLARVLIDLQKTLRHGTGHLLSSTMVEQLLDNSECGWGLGFAVAGKGKDLRFFHSGSNAGYRALVIAFANIDDGAVIMTNGDNGSQLYQEILRAIADVYDWPALRQRSIEDAAFDEHERRELTGRYAVSNSGEIVIDADGEILQARSPFWNGAARLHRAGKGKFVTLESEGLFTIQRDDRGMVSGLEITGYALPLKAKRVP
jgi:CubicO group peptidase (beta-lactamase class C family)